MGHLKSCLSAPPETHLLEPAQSSPLYYLTSSLHTHTFFQPGGERERCLYALSINFTPKRCLPRCHNHQFGRMVSSFKQAQDVLQAPPPPRGSAGSFGLGSWVLRTCEEHLAGFAHCIRIDESEASYFNSEPRVHFPSSLSLCLDHEIPINKSKGCACLPELLPRWGDNRPQSRRVQKQLNPSSLHLRHHLPTSPGWKHS